MPPRPFCLESAMTSPEVRFVLRVTELRTLPTGSYELVVQLTPLRTRTPAGSTTDPPGLRVVGTGPRRDVRKDAKGHGNRSA